MAGGTRDPSKGGVKMRAPQSEAGAARGDREKFENWPSTPKPSRSQAPPSSWRPIGGIIAELLSKLERELIRQKRAHEVLELDET